MQFHCICSSRFHPRESSLQSCDNLGQAPTQYALTPEECVQLYTVRVLDSSLLYGIRLTARNKEEAGKLPASTESACFPLALFARGR